jgi:hypothetical protein
MRQYITATQVQELSEPAWQVLAEWFEGREEQYGDDVVHVYIPEEKDGQLKGEFHDLWGSEHEFEYPEEYVGKLCNHKGTIIPLLSIGELIEFLDKHNNDDLAYRMRLITHAGGTRFNQWSFETEELLPTLWKGVKAILERGEVK